MEIINEHKIAVIFDLDGTLLDTIEDIAVGVNRGIGMFGFPPRLIPDYKRLIGNGMAELVRRVLPDDAAVSAQFGRILETVIAEYRKEVINKTRPYPHIPEMLDQLMRESIPMAILSNKPHALAVRSVKALLSRWPFAVVQGAQNGNAGKPDPEQPLRIAVRLQCRPENVFFVGDSEIDIMTAKNAGMKAVAVTWGFRRRRHLIRYSPRHLIETPEELVALVVKDRR